MQQIRGSAGVFEGEVAGKRTGKPYLEMNWSGFVKPVRDGVTVAPTNSREARCENHTQK